MEEHTVGADIDAAARLEANRAVLRGVLMPHTAGAVDADVFPRSAVMRFLLDSRRRRLAYGAFTLVWMLLGRRRRSLF